jgi:small subunit ribosomal protein S16|uniref:Ribosomal protein S16 n=1 Tax=Thorea hispida TaxID=202687 RepID=A0A1C9CAM7_9FLOR|nr:ribosomal protein S16 [Thorea hispida]AOM65427.1 ribosomal protein S16 [Thorea hispida]ARX95797.1 30S ribosomal protein S16 [Thorea hispida]UNJ79086.1 ribosomal protein S16 [Thorea hispida]
MLKIRLQRYGRKKYPSYKIIVIDSRKRSKGKPIEEIGFYNPIQEITTLNIPKVKYYISLGAQPSEIVQSIWKKVQIK